MMAGWGRRIGRGVKVKRWEKKRGREEGGLGRARKKGGIGKRRMEEKAGWKRKQERG